MVHGTWILCHDERICTAPPGELVPLLSLKITLLDSSGKIDHFGCRSSTKRISKIGARQVDLRSSLPSYKLDGWWLNVLFEQPKDYLYLNLRS